MKFNISKTYTNFIYICKKTTMGHSYYFINKTKKEYIHSKHMGDSFEDESHVLKFLANCSPGNTIKVEWDEWFEEDRDNGIYDDYKGIHLNGNFLDDGL